MAKGTELAAEPPSSTSSSAHMRARWLADARVATSLLSLASHGRRTPHRRARLRLCGGGRT